MTPDLTRREILKGATAAAALFTLPTSILAQTEGPLTMATISTRDGTEIFYKDWGPKDAQPVVFHHGWPLSGDDWDNQMLFFLGEGYRVTALNDQHCVSVYFPLFAYFHQFVKN